MTLVSKMMNVRENVVLGSLNLKNTPINNQPATTNTSETPQSKDDVDLVVITGKDDNIEGALGNLLSNNDSLIDRIASKLNGLFGDKKAEKQDRGTEAVRDYQVLTDEQLAAEMEELLKKKADIKQQIAECKADTSIPYSRNLKAIDLEKQLNQIETEIKACEEEMNRRSNSSNSSSPSGLQNLSNSSELVVETGHWKNLSVSELIQEYKEQVQAKLKDLQRQLDEAKTAKSEAESNGLSTKLTMIINAKIAVLTAKINSYSGIIQQYNSELERRGSNIRIQDDGSIMGTLENSNKPELNNDMKNLSPLCSMSTDELKSKHEELVKKQEELEKQLDAAKSKISNNAKENVLNHFEIHNLTKQLEHIKTEIKEIEDELARRDS